MIARKKEFTGGLILLLGFWIVFFIGMSPVFGEGQNILNYMDNLYNSISKNSAYYIPAMQDKISQYQGHQVDISLKGANDEEARRFQTLFAASGAAAEVDGVEVRVAGDLGLILQNVAADADVLFSNNGSQISEKYGYHEKNVLYDWWYVLSLAEKNLNKQKMFKEAKIVSQVQAKVVEPAYNYYGIEARDIKSKLGIVVASLAGYVVYTLWFGFAIFFMFEGWGLKIEH